ncbi:MAG TPA: SBBP repeat-containing protein [Chthoniobacterales bacterium]|nr:SBBP repeat-containing protein [Chthoniobacterales bacterium]
MRKSIQRFGFGTGIAVALILLWILIGRGVADAAKPRLADRPAAGPVSTERLNPAYGQLPLSFEANRGQAIASVDFLARGPGYTLSLEATQASFHLSNAGGSAVLHMQVIGGNGDVEPEGVTELEGKVNYFIGSDPKQWRQNIPTYGRVRYREVYRGIDLVYYGNQRQLEYDFIVAPGRNPGAIHLGFDGADKVAVDTNGDLLVTLGETILRQPKPLMYQEVGGKRHSVEGGYVVNADCEVSFDVGQYDAARPLIIDPTLVYSTYLGGSNSDLARAVAVDSSGNAYVTGYTTSTDFPTANAVQATLNGTAGGFGDRDVFVTKLNAAGTALIYSTYLGGSGGEEARGIAADAAGNAYVAGFTSSTNFPTANALQSSIGTDGQDAFVTKLNADGSALVYSTYLGGNGSSEFGEAIAVDSSGNVYVTGSTFSGDFPTVNPIQATFGGGTSDAFITKINAAGTALVYSTYLGGSDDAAISGVGLETGRAIAVDSSGNAYVAGEENSTNFPTANAIQATYGGGGTDAFVAKINAAGSALVYSTYLGGGAQDSGEGIKADASGNAYVAGFTQSTNFPTANAIQPVNGGTTITQDAFVTKINATGSALVYSTYLGGTGGEIAFGIAVNGAGEAYVAGSTASATSFPVMDAIQCERNGGQDLFITKFNAAGSAFVYSTYLGGSGSDDGQGIAIDSSNNAYITGSTTSTDFPTVNPIQSTNAGGSPFGDAFIVKLNDTVTPNACATPTPTPTPSPPATPTPTPTPTPSATPTPTPSATPQGQLLNLSTRSRVLTGDKVQIGGIIITGDVAKRVIFRVIGNSMKVSGTPVPGRLADPTLTLYDQSGLEMAFNDDWGMAPEPERTEIENSGFKPDDPQEPAILRTLSAGQYTVVVRGKNDTTGIAVVEAYDLDQAAASRLANLSTRSFVDTNDNLTIGGAIVGGSGVEVLVRGLGPSLKVNGVPVPERLENPTLRIVDSNGDTVVENDDWQTTQETEIAATGLQPEDSKESAIRLVLPAGGTTILLRGKDDAIGIGLVEIYQIATSGAPAYLSPGEFRFDQVVNQLRDFRVIDPVDHFIEKPADE